MAGLELEVIKGTQQKLPSRALLKGGHQRNVINRSEKVSGVGDQ